jgi:carboxymethylenebutenolidase
MRIISLIWVGIMLLVACSTSEGTGGLETESSVSSGTSVATSLPAGAADALARLEASPRHAEWVTVSMGQDSVRAWVVYPERSDPAPVVLVVHEIFGLSHWVRSVADQLAADGFIAIAPDMLTMRDLPTGADGAPDADAARSEIGSLDRDALHRQLLAVAEYGMSLPAAERRYGIVGFCLGGTVSFEHAIRSPELGASIVYYGTSPDTALLGSIQAPVLGLYGENDARVNSTVPGAEAAMGRSDKTFEHEIFAGAGHGFLRQQDGQDGANLAAARLAWPRTVEWFRAHLER